MIITIRFKDFGTIALVILKATSIKFTPDTIIIDFKTDSDAKSAFQMLTNNTKNKFSIGLLHGVILIHVTDIIDCICES